MRTPPPFDSRRSVRVWGLVHPGSTLCWSLPTKDTDLLVVETTFKILSRNLEELAVSYTYDCLGSSFELDRYISTLRSGRIENIKKATQVYPPIQVVKKPRVEWRRIQISANYRTPKLGVYPFISSLGLECPTSVVIYDGRESLFLRSKRELRPSGWDRVKEKLRDPEVIAEVYRLGPVRERDFDSLRMFKLLHGVFSIIPRFSHCLLDSYVQSLRKAIISRLTQLKSRHMESIVDILSRWGPIEEYVFMDRLSSHNDAWDTTHRTGRAFARSRVGLYPVHVSRSLLDRGVLDAANEMVSQDLARMRDFFQAGCNIEERVVREILIQKYMWEDDP
jgi:hypothetical protein